MAEYVSKDAVRRMLINGYGGFLSELDTLPVVDVTSVVHGYWKRTIDGRWECSNCGAHENPHTAIKGHYCWQCGAKMDLEE